MEFGWLQQGAVKVFSAMSPWLGMPRAAWLSGMAGAGALVLVIA